ncbi:MAG: DUF1343 domain-containing protein [Paludibacteraceae bacterium]|nr:DUF1343 domain-containing protein [Paludibacteraceae bacterium]
MKGKFFLVTLISSVIWASVAAQVKTGIDVLQESGFSILAGKKVGLLTNPTGIDRNMRSTIDILYAAKEVDLTTLFAPEHGIRGSELAGALVANTVDKLTGLPVYSLHGKTRKPTAEMLKNVDVIVYDIQDIGCRSYTFISSLGNVMEAAAQFNKEVVVLDRPNPLGGEKVEGPLVRDGFYSFVSNFNIPYVYGLTVGELAGLVNNERPVDKRCRLTVVKMDGWKRNMTFGETGLPWVLTSPQIPTPEAAVAYPMSGIIGELYAIQIGVGYTLPFQVFAAEWIDGEALAKAMNRLNLPGISFRPITFKPYFGISSGKAVSGVQVYVTDYRKAALTEVQWYVAQELHRMYPNHDLFKLGNLKNYNMFDNVCGTSQVRQLLTKRYQTADLLPFWRADAEAFKVRSSAYKLY